MSSIPTAPKSIPIHSPRAIKNLKFPLSEFLSEHPRYTTIVVGACIFSPQPDHTTTTTTTTLPNPSDEQPSPPYILLVQRAATEHAFPNMWEVPGGSCEFTDPTILHSLAREVYEETDLHLTRVVRQIGNGVEFSSGATIPDENGVAKPIRVFLKLTFEIEVAELEPQNLRLLAASRPHNGQSSDPTSSVATSAAPTNFASPSSPSSSSSSSPSPPPSPSPSFPSSSPSDPPIKIILDPEEHQRYAWVTEESFKQQNPSIKYPTISECQRRTILQAFELRRRS